MRVDDFLENNDVIRGLSTRDEARLERANNSVQVRPNAANNNFGNHFIRNIAKANRAKLINGLGTIKVQGKMTASDVF